MNRGQAQVDERGVNDEDIVLDLDLQLAIDLIESLCPENQEECMILIDVPVQFFVHPAIGGNAYGPANVEIMHILRYWLLCTLPCWTGFPDESAGHGHTK